MLTVANKIFLIIILILNTDFTGAQIASGGSSHGTYICDYCNVTQSQPNGFVTAFIRGVVNPAHPFPWLNNDYVIIGDGNGNSSVWQRIGGTSIWSLVVANGEDVGPGSTPDGNPGGPNGSGEGGASSGGGPIWTGGGSGGTGGGGGSSCHGVMVNNCVGDSCTATCQEF